MQSSLVGLGCISYNFLIRERKENKNNFIITPLLGCHIEKYCLVELTVYYGEDKSESSQVKTYDFFPIAEHQIKQILHEKTKNPIFSSSGQTLQSIFNVPKLPLTSAASNKFDLKMGKDVFHFSVWGCIRISKPDTNKVSGSVWCTLWTNHHASVKESSNKNKEEYWLTQENVPISKFIVSFMDTKNIAISKKFLVSYEIYKMDTNFLQGKANLNEENTLLFSKNMAC